MSMTTPLASSRLSSRQLHHHIKPCNNNTTDLQPFFFNPLSQLPISIHKINGNGFSFPCNRSFQYLISNGKRAQGDSNSKMDFAIYNSSTDRQGDLISFGPLLNSWKAWILGGLLTVILPFFTNKWGPLLKWTKNLEIVEEQVEEIAEVVEKVAEEVEKVAEEIEKKLPDGGKLKSAVTLVENVAKKTAKDADKVEELLEKVENMEKRVDAIIEAEVNKSSAAAKKVDKSNAAAKVDKSTT